MDRLETCRGMRRRSSRAGDTEEGASDGDLISEPERS
jgi:hypothetical protein